jgi:alkylhydroperoxidase family enzyme
MTSKLFLPDVENAERAGHHADLARAMKAAGVPVPQILHLFAFKPQRTRHLANFTQGVMRGPSELSAGERELIAALVSKRNECEF